MALIKCSDCGTNVSEKASACPKCGCPIEISIEHENTNKRKKIKHIVLVFIFFIIILLLSLGVYKIVNRSDKSGYYNGLKWGMTCEEVQDQLGEDAFIDKDKKSVVINYKDYEGKKNIDTLASYDCTGDSLNMITLFISNGDSSSYTDESLLDEYINQLDKLYGEHEEDTIYYTWRTEKSRVELSYLFNNVVVLKYEDITKTKD